METNKTLLKIREKLKIMKTKNHILKTKEENRGLKINLPEKFKKNRYQTKTFLL